MSLGSGYNAFVGIGEEATFGTAVAATIFPEIESENLKGKRIPLVSKVLGTLSRKRTTKSKTEVNGGFKFPMVWTGFEKVIKHTLGGTTATGGGSSMTTTGSNPYTHTGSLKAPMPTGLTIVANRDAAALGAGTMFRYKGCQINKLTLSQEIEGPLMAEVEILGSDYDSTTIVSPTPPTWDPIEYAQMTIAKMHVAAATDMFLRKWSLTIDNKLEPLYRLTSAASGGVVRADHREVMFECEMEFVDLAVYTKLRDALTDDFQFKWVKDANTDLTITLPKVFLDGEEPDTGGPGPYYLTAKGQALMSAADNDELTIALKNATAGPF